MIARPALLLCGALLAPAGLDAQTAAGPDVMVRRHAIEVGAIVGWSGGFNIGSTLATMPRNPAIGDDPFPLFAADGRQEASAVFGMTVGFTVNPRVSVEAFGSLSQPGIRLTISQDAELTGGADVSQGGLTEYGFGGNLLVHFPNQAFGRVVPFLQAGAGVLWQVAADTSFERAHLIRAGGGVRYLFASRRGRKPSAAGLRADLLLLFRGGGLQLDSGERVTASAGGGLFIAF